MAVIGPSVTLGSIGPSSTPVVNYSTFFAAIQSPWGQDGVATLCSSFSDFQRKFGGLNKLSTLAADGSADTWSTETSDGAVQAYYAVKGFFDEKQGNPNAVAIIARVVKSSGGATAAALTINDGAAHNTVVTSKWKGAAGGTTTVQVTNPSPEKGGNYAKFVIANSQAGITEIWQISNTAEAANASAKSELVTITVPAVAGQMASTNATAKKLGNGVPGTADAFNATAADMVGTTDSANNTTGLQCFNNYRFGSGIVAVPGFSSSQIGAGLKTHIEAWGRIGFVGASAGLTKATVVADLGSTFTSNFGAYYWPRLKVQDQNSDAGGLLVIDPVGHIAGLAARMDGKFGGPHKSPAGIDHQLGSVIDLERQSNGNELCDDPTSNTLADSYVNTIRIKRGVTVWGLRSTGTDNRYRQIQVGRTVALIQLTCYQIGEPRTFDAIDPDGNLFARLRGEVYGFLYQLRKNGVLYGDYPGSDAKPTDAFAVVCDRGNNTDLTVGAGELHCDIAVAVTPNAEQVKFNLLLAQPGFVAGRSVTGT